MRCVECGSPVDPNSMSFEMRLVDIQDFCRRCFDEIIEEELPDHLVSVEQLNKL
jgi:hypothetical protein